MLIIKSFDISMGFVCIQRAIEGLCFPPVGAVSSVACLCRMCKVPGYAVFKVMNMIKDYVFTPTESELAENDPRDAHMLQTHYSVHAYSSLNLSCGLPHRD